MNWDDTPEEAAFRAAARAFIEERFPASYRPAGDEEQSLEPEDVAGYNWPVDRVADDAARREGARAWAAALAERAGSRPIGRVSTAARACRPWRSSSCTRR